MFVACAVFSAHATLVSSEPAASSLLTASPHSVRLVFSEPVEASLARLHLIASGGAVTMLAVAGDPHDVNALTAPVMDLGAGSYRLAWRIVSADGHPVDGSFVFSVGTVSDRTPPDLGSLAAQGPLPPVVAGAPLLPSALRGFAVGNLAALAGLLLFLTWARAAGDVTEGRAANVANILGAAAPVLLALHGVAWVLDASPEHRLTADAMSSALASGTGRMEMWRVGLAVGAWWSLWLLRREGVALAFAVAALVVSGASGHAAAIAPLWATPAKAIHLLSTAAWLGGLVWLLTRDRGDAVAFARDAARLSAVALPAAVFVTLSGLLQALLFAASVRELVFSGYGAVLAVKIAGLLVLVAFGAFHRYRMLPALAGPSSTSQSFTTSLRRETAVMCLVLLAGGLLAYVPIPRQ
jgi:copper transport protein